MKQMESVRRAVRSSAYFYDLLPEISNKKVLVIDRPEMAETLCREDNQFADQITGTVCREAEAGGRDGKEADVIILKAECLPRGMEILGLTSHLLEKLPEEGCLLLAVNNPLGFQYFAGYTESGDAAFSAPSGYNEEKRTDYAALMDFVSRETEKDMRADVYYPFPNYDYCVYLFTDERLPRPGEVKTKYPWIDGAAQLSVYDDYHVLDALIRNGMFRQCANSYIVVFHKGAAGRKSRKNARLLYAKYSLARRSDLRISTSLRKTSDGNLSIEKTPADPRAKEHVESLYEKMQGLNARIAANKSPLQANRCRKEGDSVFLEYLQGQTLGDLLKECLQERDYDRFDFLLAKYREMVEEIFPTQDFQSTPDFEKIFGRQSLGEGVPAVRGLDIDMIPENIIIRDGIWNLIDYEWTYDFPIPLGYLYYRTVLFFLLLRENTQDDHVSRKSMLKFFGISREDFAVYQNMEQNFQDFVGGETEEDRNFRPAVLTAAGALQGDRIEHVQIYYDCGNGLSEEDSTHTFLTNTGDRLQVNVTVPETCRLIRIDPTAGPCLLRVDSLLAAGKDKEKEISYETNGTSLDDRGSFIFRDDPQIWIQHLPEGTVSVTLRFRIRDLEASLAADLTEGAGGRKRIAEAVKAELPSLRSANLLKRKKAVEKILEAAEAGEDS
ncbi:MAG: hypothetical protein U0L49_11135 [Eubacterium sp.]|nr:hypothetical protein [Eubacterium sp.]